MADPTYEVVEMTPEMAESILAKNTHNRNIRERQVEAYARDMSKGDWLFTGEAIKIGWDGVVIDGQHRLMAVVLSGATVRMPVIRGLDPASQEAVDTGVGRKLPDVLKLRGEVNVNQLAGILRAVFYWDEGYRNLNSINFKATIPQLLDLLERKPELREIAKEAHQVAQHSELTTSIAGLTMYLFDAIDSDDSAYFFDRLKSETGHERGDPIYELRRTLQEASKKVRGERSRTWMLGITIKAWNFYREGSTVKAYRLALGGSAPEKFPEPN